MKRQGSLHLLAGRAQLRLSILLLLLCAIVAGYVFFFERGEVPEGKVVLTSDPARVSHIELIANPKSKPLVIERAPGGWRIAKPVGARADANKVRALLEKMRRLESQGQFEVRASRLGGYGLGPSESRLTLFLRDGRHLSVCVGRKTPDAAAAYARLPGSSTVFLVNASLAEDLSKGPEDFRDRKVVAFKRDRVCAIALKYPATELELRRKGAEWEISKPVKAAADEEAVNSLLAALDRMEAVAFVSDATENLAAYGLVRPALYLSLWHRGDRRVRQVQFGRKRRGDEVFARRAGEAAVFSVGGGDFRQVAKKFSDLRSKRVIAFERNNVKAIKVAAPGRWLFCERRGNSGWEITRPRQMVADIPSVDDLLFNLSELRAERVYDAPAPQTLAILARPVASVRLKMKRGGDTKVDLARASDQQRLYARTDATGPVFVVTSDILTSATPDLGHWRDKTVFRVKRGRIVGIRLVSGRGQIELRRGRGERWDIEKPVKAKADKPKVEDMLWVLEDVRGDQFVEEKPRDLSRYGLDKPQLTVEVQLEGGKRDSLLFGKKTEKGDRIYIKSKSRPEVFLKDRYVLDDLSKKVQDLL